MEIVQVGRYFVSLRDVGVVLVRRAGNADGFAYALCLFVGLLSPYARVQIAGFLLEEVHCYIEELKACAAAEEHHFVGVGNVENLFPQGAAFIHHLIPARGAVRDGN